MAEALLDGPREVAVVGPPDDAARTLLHTVALASTAPGLVVSVGGPDADGVPLLAGRILIDGRATAYVCRDFACALPTIDQYVLAGQLRAGPTGGLIDQPFAVALGPSMSVYIRQT